jgi:hypothetical protein
MATTPEKVQSTNKNGGFVPDGAGNSIFVPYLKYVKGAYYAYLATVDGWKVITDQTEYNSVSNGDIVYTYSVATGGSAWDGTVAPDAKILYSSAAETGYPGVKVLGPDDVHGGFLVTHLYNDILHQNMLQLYGGSNSAGNGGGLTLPLLSKIGWRADAGAYAPDTQLSRTGVGVVSVDGTTAGDGLGAIGLAGGLTFRATSNVWGGYRFGFYSGPNEGFSISPGWGIGIQISDVIYWTSNNGADLAYAAARISHPPATPGLISLDKDATFDGLGTLKAGGLKFDYASLVRIDTTLGNTNAQALTAGLVEGDVYIAYDTTQEWLGITKGA